MTIKQKFSSIDQSKLTADQKSFLDKIKNVTKNFSDAEMNKKVEQPLDNFIAKAKEKMPEAVKSAPARSTDKPKPSQTRKPKRTPMSLAKEIRKAGESWSDARARASKMMKEDSKDLSKTVETELDKLSKLVRSQKTRSKLVGISGTNIKRDSARRAKPRGRRISKEGNVYYENRDNRTDRLAPNYPKNAPLLQAGGDIDAFTLRMVKSNGMQPAEMLKEDTNLKYAGGGFFRTSRPKSALMRDRKNVNHSEDYEVRYSKPRPSRTGYKDNRRFELGGVMTTDLAGHTGGGTGGLNTGSPLNGFSNTGYTGLVGETGAMSSGEMFMNGGGLPSGAEQSYMITESFGNPAQHFNKGGALTNERKHVNHDEDYEVRYAKPRPSRKGYKGVRKFMSGGAMETPRIYVADLEAYNNGRLVGEWLDLADYNDADELMDAIQDVLKKSGGEEYAIHDIEYVPRSMYSEYMGKRDFEELYEMMDLAKDNDLPLEVVQDIVSQYDASAVNEFVGKYDSADDFAKQLVDDMGGIQNFSNFQSYLTISETDRRLLAQEMADSYVNDIRDEDNGNRLIEEANLDVEEYEEADSDRQEEMLDEAKEIVYDEYYDTWYDGLSDPYYFLVKEQGLYSADDFANANFVQVDYEDLGDALEDDYAYIFYNSDLYVFNIR